MTQQTLTTPRRGGFEGRRAGFEAQRGGFAVGLIIGLLIGLGLALGVALYVTKVPIPFVNKVPQRTAVQDAAEVEKNRNWDPNSPLYGKNPARPSAGTGGVVAPPAAPPAPTANLPTQAPTAGGAPVTVLVPAARASAPKSARDPAAILADRSSGAKPAASGAAASGADPFSYFVQAGAYARTEDADQQRANLTMMGLEGKITEREQSGRTVYRVRVGPFEKKADADAAKERLVASGVEAQLVRVQR
jgi:cell division protein FtsN